MMYGPRETGTCPHCQTAVRFEEVEVGTGWKESSAGRASHIVVKTKSNCQTRLEVSACPHCGRAVLYLTEENVGSGMPYKHRQLLWPDTAERPVPEEVSDEDPDLAEDFREACTVLPKSEKASAALSRRCLEKVLVEKAGATGSNLSKKIDSVLEDMPTYIAENVDAIRQVGNFAAHPKKSESTGEIVDVEDGEAEWLLEVLEELFDFYYVQPAKAREKREDLNKKLDDMGKPKLKAPDSEEEGDH